MNLKNNLTILQHQTLMFVADKGECSISYDNLRKELCISRMTAIRAVNKLIKLGFISKSVSPHQRANTYKALAPALLLASIMDNSLSSKQV